MTGARSSRFGQLVALARRMLADDAAGRCRCATSPPDLCGVHALAGAPDAATRMGWAYEIAAVAIESAASRGEL